MAATSDAFTGFAGFTAGKTRFTPIPSEFFAEVLPICDDLNELKAILYTLWRLGQGEGDVRYVRLDDVLVDLLFLKGLQVPDGDQGQGSPESAARAAFGRAAQRGVLIEITVQRQGRSEVWYFLNSAKGREAVDKLRRGEFTGLIHDIDEVVVGLEKERPNIFLLYEQNIGMVGPLLADKLRQAERDYPEDWIRDAFSLAVERNKRTWSYIQTILSNWAEHGKDIPGQSGRSLAPGSTKPKDDDEYTQRFILE